MSCGSSSYMAISSSTTWRSGSTSRNAGRHTMSAITSNAHRQVLVEHPRVDGGALLVGAGVELGAHAVEQLVDLRRARSASVPRNSMCSRKCERPASASRLAARAGAHEEAQGRGPDGGHDLRDDPQPRVQLGQAVFGQGAGRLSSRSGSRSARGAALAAAARRGRGRARRGLRGRRRRGRHGAGRGRRRRALAAAAAGADAGQLLDGLAGDLRVLGQAQADAAALAVDLDHAHGDLVALVEDLLDRVDPLAGRDVGDVQQAVGALGELDEGAERGRLDDLARRTRRRPRPPWSSSGCGRPGRRPGCRSARRRGPGPRRRRRSAPRTPRTGRGSSRRPCRSAGRSCPGRSGSSRCAARTSTARARGALDDLGHLAEDERAPLLGLRERVAQDVEGHAGDLDVHLERGDARSPCRRP